MQCAEDPVETHYLLPEKMLVPAASHGIMALVSLGQLAGIEEAP